MTELPEEEQRKIFESLPRGTWIIIEIRLLAEYYAVAASKAQ